MQEKLIKLLKVKIDAINKNIENLNYLNKELDSNKNDLDYLDNILELLNTESVLDLDKIDQDDFNKTMEMLDSSIRDIFNDKTCNYQGIMYIIRGIRDGISLELTSEQVKAINSYTEAIKEKIDNLEVTIQKLEDTKEKLPETNLATLEDDLIKFKEIITNLENNNYLTQIEDIVEVLDFTNISSLEKIDIFSYILKYNRDVYKNLNIDTKEEVVEETPNLQEVKIDNLEDEKIDFFADKDYDLPSLNLGHIENYSEPASELKTNLNNTVDLDDIIQKIDLKLKELDEEEKLENEKKSLKVEDESSESVDLQPETLKSLEEKPVDVKLDTAINGIDFEKFKLPPQEENLKESIEEENLLDELTPEAQEIASPTFKINEEIKNKQFENNPNGFQTFTNFSDLNIEPALENSKEAIESEEENSYLKENNLDQIELPSFNKNNIIEDNLNNKKEELATSNPEPSIDELNKIPDLLNKYEINLDIQSKIIENPYLKNDNLEEKFKLLDENKILSILKEKGDLLYQTLLNAKENLENVISIIKNELVIKEDDYSKILTIIIDTMPLIFTNSSISEVFIKNIAFYKENNINLINLFDNYRELLIIDTNSLKQNLEIVKTYGLTLNNDNVKYLLCNKNLLTNLDYYLEAIGHEKGFLGTHQDFDGLSYIKEYPYKLNMISSDVLMKLRYATENNLKIYGSKQGVLAGEVTNPKVDILTLTPEYKNLYFKNEYEFIDRSDIVQIEEELAKNTSLDISIDENITKLDTNYKISDVRYKINDLYFSRIKVIRLYNYLKLKNLKPLHALIIALTYNSVLKKDEYIKVKDLITNLVEGGN